MEQLIEKLIEEALSEDIGHGDITSEAVIPEEAKELFRKRDGYSIFLFPYSISETGVKVEYHGAQPEIVKKGAV